MVHEDQARRSRTSHAHADAHAAGAESDVLQKVKVKVSGESERDFSETRFEQFQGPLERPERLKRVIPPAIPPGDMLPAPPIGRPSLGQSGAVGSSTAPASLRAPVNLKLHRQLLLLRHYV